MDGATEAYTSWGQPLAVASGITAGVSGVVAVVAFSMLALLEEGP